MFTPLVHSLATRLFIVYDSNACDQMLVEFMAENNLEYNSVNVLEHRPIPCR